MTQNAYRIEPLGDGRYLLTAPDGLNITVSGDRTPSQGDAREIFGYAATHKLAPTPTTPTTPPAPPPQRGGIFNVAARGGTITEQAAPGQTGIGPVDPIAIAQVARGFGEGLIHLPVPEPIQPATIYRRASDVVFGEPQTELPRGTDRERVAKMVGKALGLPGIAGAAVGGVVRGAGGAANILRSVLQGGVTAGVAADEPGDVPLAAAGGAAAGGAMSVAGHGAGAIFRRLGRLNRPALRLIAQKGIKGVSDPELMQPDYIGREVVPKIKREIMATVTTPGTSESVAAKKALGLNARDMEMLRRVRPETFQSDEFLQAVASNNADEMGAFVTAARERANTMFDTDVVQAAKGKLINVSGTLDKLRGALAGRVDETGRVVKKFLPGTEPTRAERRLLQIYEALAARREQAGMGNVYIKPEDYLLLRRTSQEIAQAQPSLAQAARGLYRGVADDAAEVLPAIKEANKAYAEAKALEALEPKLRKIADIDNRINNTVKKAISSNFAGDIRAAEDLVGRETLDKSRIAAMWEAIRAPDIGAPGVVSGGLPGVRESIEAGTTPLMRAANIQWYGRPGLRSAARQTVMRPGGVAAGEATRETR